MKLLAPIMPFITEELYHNWKEILDSEHDSIHQCEYPQSIDLDGIEIDKVTESMNLILSISKQILSTLGMLRIGRNRKINAYISGKFYCSKHIA